MLFMLFNTKSYKESMPFFLSDLVVRIFSDLKKKKKKEETNVYISFPSHNLRISRIVFVSLHLQNAITYPRFCIQVLDRPTYRLSPHGRKRAQDCTDTWMPLRSNSSRTRRISFRPGRYRIDADSAAC